MLPIDVVQKTMESIETGDMETTGIYLAESLACAGLAPDPVGKYEFIEMMTGLLNAVPNWSYNTREMNERGSVVRARVRITGANTGEINLPAVGIRRLRPTGVRFTLPEERIEYAVRENKIYSIRIESPAGSQLSALFKQLGVEMPEKVAV